MLHPELSSRFRILFSSLWWNPIVQLIVLGSMSSYPRGTNPKAKATGTIAQQPTSTERKAVGLFRDVDAMVAQSEFQNTTSLHEKR